MTSISPASTPRLAFSSRRGPATTVPQRPPAPIPPSGGAAHAPDIPADGDVRSLYLKALTWAFTLFNSVRMLAYLPTTWAIVSSGDSSQHSLWTWCTWLGANLTMAAWLYEHNGRRLNRAIAVNICNSLMCLAASILIVAYRV